MFATTWAPKNILSQRLVTICQPAPQGSRRSLRHSCTWSRFVVEELRPHLLTAGYRLHYAHPSLSFLRRSCDSIFPHTSVTRPHRSSDSTYGAERCAQPSVDLAPYQQDFRNSR